VGMDRFGRPECADSLTLRITAKEDHWMNFWEAGALVALPKHVWEGKDFNLINWELPVVSGPYQLDEVKKDRSVSMKRRDDWWGFSRRFNQHKYNFRTIRWKFMEDQLKALEAFKKGDIDVFPVGRAAIWAEKTDFDQVKKGWVGKTRVFNYNPMGFRGFIVNLRRPLFQDPKVREALALLANRKVMNEKFNHNLFFLLNTYFADIYPDKTAPGRPVTPYDPARARALLAEAGWKPGPDGVLAKGGKRFEITLSLTTGADMRPINVYVEDLKAVGILAKVEELSWSTYAKRMDKYEFDMGLAAWGGVRLRDPESMWHSRTAKEPSSNNVAGVQDKVVDSLIQYQKTEPDMEKRRANLAKLDDRLNELRPYVLLWEKDSQWLLWWNKFGTARWIYPRNNDEESITTYWYADPAKEKALAEAMQSGKSLPPPPAEVRYGK
jgi:microcin C transport system substrate-binding protein